jgi:polar amino acid transport system substrate-binding protein
MTTIIEFNDPPVPHGLIMSKKALSATQMETWRSVINAMRADGTLRRIFGKYFQPDLANALVNF